MQQQAYLVRSRLGYDKLIEKLSKSGFTWNTSKALEKYNAFDELGRCVIVIEQDKRIQAISLAKYTGDVMYTDYQPKLTIID